MNKKIAAHLGLLLVNLIYGTNYIIAKDLMLSIGPFALVALRGIGAGLLFLLVHQIFVREKVDKKDIPKLLLCSFFGAFVNMPLFLKGLSLTGPVNAALLMITVPILILVFERLLYKYLIGKKKVLGMMIGATGVFIIQLNALNDVSSNFLGNLFIILNASSYAFYLVLVRPFMAKYHPFTVLKWLFGVSALPLFFIGYPELTEVVWSAWVPSTWMALCYVIVAVTFLTYLLNISALKVVDASMVGMYIYTQPIIASILAVILQVEVLTIPVVIAGFLIAIGIYLVSRK